MDWYYGSGISDLLVPKDEDLMDWLPSPDSWLNWGTGAHEGFSSHKKYLSMDISPTEVEFNFSDVSFNDETESSLHDKDQSSSSSVCGGLPEQSFQQTALSCGQTNYQLQELSRFEQMDDIFLDSVLEDLPSVENLNKSFCFSPAPQYSNTSGGLQKEITSSKFVPCNSKLIDCLDMKAPPVKGLDPYEQSSRDGCCIEPSSLEEFVLQDLEMVIAQFTEKTRICFRDALYRLAQNTKQHVVEDQDGDLRMHIAMPQMDQYEKARSKDKKLMESETNTVDRTIANLMFNKMEINVQDLLLSASVNCKQELMGTNGPQGKSSKNLNLAQDFDPQPPPNLLSDSKVPRFGQRDQQTATELHITYGDPPKKSCLLEFG